MITSGLLVQDRAHFRGFPSSYRNNPKKVLRPFVDGLDTGVTTISKPFEIQNGLPPPVPKGPVSYRSIFGRGTTPDERAYFLQNLMTEKEYQHSLLPRGRKIPSIRNKKAIIQNPLYQNWMDGMDDGNIVVNGGPMAVDPDTYHYRGNPPPSSATSSTGPSRRASLISGQTNSPIDQMDVDRVITDALGGNEDALIQARLGDLGIVGSPQSNVASSTSGSRSQASRGPLRINTRPMTREELGAGLGLLPTFEEQVQLIPQRLGFGPRRDSGYSFTNSVGFNEAAEDLARAQATSEFIVANNQRLFDDLRSELADVSSRSPTSTHYSSARSSVVSGGSNGQGSVNSPTVQDLEAAAEQKRKGKAVTSPSVRSDGAPGPSRGFRPPSVSSSEGKPGPSGFQEELVKGKGKLKKVVVKPIIRREENSLGGILAQRLAKRRKALEEDESSFPNIDDSE